jgi:phosphopantetheine--protein transferase-like protein
MENEILKTLGILKTTGKFTIGNDLVYLPEFSASFNELFKKKVYTTAEITYCDAFDNSVLRYASTWAAKEAVYKAIKQIHFATLGWKKIEIIRKKNAGQPQVIIHNLPADYKISLTISHDGEYVWAIALIENDV